MRDHRKLALSFVLILLLGADRSAVAQLAPIGAAVATDVAITRLSTAIKDIISKLESSVSVSSFRITSDMRRLLSEVEHIASATTETVFGEIARERAEILNGIARTVDEVQQGLAQGVATLEPLVARTTDTINNLPFTAKRPRVLTIGPTHVLSPPSTTLPVLVKINGSFLKWGPATLQMGGQRCTLSRHLDNDIEFTCPAATFVSAMAVKRVFGELTVTEEKEWFDSVRTLFGGELDKKSYQMSIVVIPPVLGTLEIRTEHKVKERKFEQPPPMPYGHQNEYCQGRRTEIVRVAPTPGWKVDTRPGRIKIDGSGSVRGGGRAGGHGPPVEVSETGFFFRYWADNKPSTGIGSLGCGTSLGPRDRRGWYYGNVSWFEWQEVERPISTALPARTLTWGKAETIRMPTPLSSYVLTVRQIDNRVVSTSGSEAPDWFRIERQPGGLNLIIKPKTLTEAFR